MLAFEHVRGIDDQRAGDPRHVPDSEGPVEIVDAPHVRHLRRERECEDNSEECRAGENGGQLANAARAQEWFWRHRPGATGAGTAANRSSAPRFR